MLGPNLGSLLYRNVSVMSLTRMFKGKLIDCKHKEASNSIDIIVIYNPYTGQALYNTMLGSIELDCDINELLYEGII